MYIIGPMLHCRKDPLMAGMYNPGDINEYLNEDNFFKLSARNKEIPFFFDKRISQFV
jgi:hypothetical protein